MCRHPRKDPACSKNDFMSMSLTLGPAILSLHYLFAVCTAGQVEALPSGASAQGRLGSIILQVVGFLPAAQAPLSALPVASPRSRLW